MSGASLATSAVERPAASTPRPRIRLWVLSLGWSLVLILVMLVLQQIETMLGVRRGLAGRQPSDLAMRMVGLAHYAVAAFFLVTGARARSAAGGLWIGGTLAAGVGMAVMFATVGGRANPLALVAFLVLFMAHAFHDEVFFQGEYARAAGQPIRDPRHALAWLQLAAVALVGAMLGTVAVLTAHPESSRWLAAAVGARHRPNRQQSRALETLLPGWTAGEILAAFALPFALVFAVSVVCFLVAARAGRASERRPIVLVFMASIGLLVASSVLGTWLIDVVILMHFVAWFVFTSERLGAPGHAVAVRPARPWTIPWFRGTRRGFWVLHGGLALLFLALFLVQRHVLRQQPIALGDWSIPDPLYAILNSDAFQYWTIIHLALSLVPKGAGRPQAALTVAAPAS